MQIFLQTKNDWMNESWNQFMRSLSCVIRVCVKILIDWMETFIRKRYYTIFILQLLVYGAVVGTVVEIEV